MLNNATCRCGSKDLPDDFLAGYALQSEMHEATQVKMRSPLRPLRRLWLHSVILVTLCIKKGHCVELLYMNETHLNKWYKMFISLSIISVSV